MPRGGGGGGGGGIDDIMLDVKVCAGGKALKIIHHIGGHEVRVRGGGLGLQELVELFAVEAGPPVETGVGVGEFQGVESAGLGDKTEVGLLLPWHEHRIAIDDVAVFKTGGGGGASDLPGRRRAMVDHRRDGPGIDVKQGHRERAPPASTISGNRDRQPRLGVVDFF